MVHPKRKNKTKDKYSTRNSYRKKYSTKRKHMARYSTKTKVKKNKSRLTRKKNLQKKRNKRNKRIKTITKLQSGGGNFALELKGAELKTNFLSKADFQKALIEKRRDTILEISEAIDKLCHDDLFAGATEDDKIKVTSKYISNYLPASNPLTVDIIFTPSHDRGTVKVPQGGES